MAKYNQIAQHYLERRSDKSRFDYNRDIEVPAIVKMIGHVKNKVVLDMGCGFGDHAKILSRQNPKNIIGFDKSSEMVRLARMSNPKYQFEVADMDRKLHYPKDTFDIVFSSLAVHYVKNLVQLFSEVHRVLKKGGLFIFSTGHPVFNLINQSKKYMIGVERKQKKIVIHGNYFDEAKRIANLGSLGKIKIYNYALETFFKIGLKKFELVDYCDAKPVPSSRKCDSQKYKLTTTLPTFVIFKFRK
jgi:ubiquinone/menaquinone biosynthesis C-methylase UbiE